MVCAIARFSPNVYTKCYVFVIIDVFSIIYGPEWAETLTNSKKENKNKKPHQSHYSNRMGHFCL